MYEYLVGIKILVDVIINKGSIYWVCPTCRMLFHDVLFTPHTISIRQVLLLTSFYR